jgi:ABC-type Fe3+ transport system substrate-binding protein
MFNSKHPWSNRLWRFAVVALTLLSAGAPVWAADAAMIAAAKKEGQVVWYTTQIINQFARPAADAFQKKYGIKVNYVRADSKAVTLRLLNEGRAGRVQADVFDGTAGVAPLKKLNLVEKWVPDSVSRLDKQFVDVNGYWTATNLYVLSPAFNTKLIPAAEAPKTLEDLLNPKWKGKITWNASPTMSGSAGFVGMIITTMGEQKGREYLQKLADQNLFPLQMSAREVLNQVIRGESQIALNIFNNHAVISSGEGAPVAWIPMQPVTGVLSVAALTKGAPHPNAGKLFIDFLVSPEGQAIFRDADYIPVDPKIAPRHPELKPDGTKLRAVYFSPEQIDAGMPKWMNIYKEYFQQ